MVHDVHLNSFLQTKGGRVAALAILGFSGFRQGLMESARLGMLLLPCQAQ